MPCFSCGARQTDPVRGASPWRRGVRADRQVLVCPGCQSVHGWADGLDRCTACESAALVCRLGEVECRDCGHTREAVRDDLVRAGAPGGADERDLSAEVAAALSRVLSRGPAG
ncbi:MULTISPECIES: hypothetical protein [Actinomadura]|uniref:hypothetical protein n=1 Tax=Actinomadura TaxID=1988 RepID=UPI0004201A15|nr:MULTISPECIES: hypothetical protein [Actinomadura]RSN68174.1 hypothetical protein DMH08_11515 [Actinomadura sp. WAC 06369]